MEKQKYVKGDLVKIAKNLGPCMKFFISDCEAIVIGSYADRVGGDHKKDHYTLHIKGHSQHSWYKEHQLTLIAHNQLELLKKWEEEEEKEER